MYRRKTEQDEELAARVLQLENLIRMQNQTTSQLTDHRGSESAALLLGELGHPSQSVEQSAVEEAAVAALGQLSKVAPNEGGSEARICE